MSKKVLALLLCLGLLLACSGCQQPQPAPPPTPEPQLAQLRSICELAVMECYYHNVAKFTEKDAAGFLFWKKDKRFWIEYSGVVTLGIDATLVEMSLDGDQVTITLPPARVVSCTVDSSSLSENSFIVDQASAQIAAEDERLAFEQAQRDMEASARNDHTLLADARQRAQTLLENYVQSVGAALGRTYTIQWVLLEEETTAGGIPRK